MKESPRRSLMKLLSAAAVASFLFAGSASQAQSPSDVWSLASSAKKAKLEKGSLSLLPADEAWNRAIAFSKEPLRFWSKEGVTVDMRISMQTKAQGDSGDAALWIGFVPKPGTSIQEMESFAGVGVSFGRKDGSLHIGLARKEAGGKDKAAQGDARGNIVYYSGAPAKLVLPKDGVIELSLTITEGQVSVSVPACSYSEKQPSGLTKELWRKAYLVAQCMNINDGRGAATVDKLSMKLPPDLLAAVKPLDLRPFANMGFKDEADGDGKGGWTDQGDNDLRYMPLGLQKIHSIPFDIINPDSNGGKSCLLLYSRNKEFLPKQIGPVPVGGKAGSLVFLHSAAWAGTPGTKAAIYRVSYSDGGSVEIPVKTGEQISDWWGMKDVNGSDAGLFMKVKSDKSYTGLVGLYAFRWKNPEPEREIASLTFLSALGDPVVGVIAVSVAPDGAAVEAALKEAFEREIEVDFKKDPPDKAEVPDQVFLKAPKAITEDAFSVAGSYNGGRGGEATLKLPTYASLINDFGGATRFPYGIDITFFFWPYQAKEWFPALGEKGGTYGNISKWYYKWGNAETTLSYQTMLESYKRLGLKLVLLFNTHAMFDGKDFVYVKTLPEDKMKRLNPLDGGEFNRANLEAIVKNNATLVDYVIKNGYEDTVSFWEMDNERWDMKGAEYAEVVAAHVKMLRSKLPKAKVVVCLGEYGSYSVNPNGVYAVVWSKELLAKLKDLGMAGQIDYFAPHLYPFLSDKAHEITQNHLQDYSVRNIYRSLDFMSGLLDAYGFQSSKLFISEWGTQSDELGDESRNDLICGMASAIATAKDMMAIYSHPRVEASTWHQFFHASYVSKSKSKPISKWGCQSLFIDEGGRVIGTPGSEGVKLFVQFARGATLEPVQLELPKGVHCLAARGKDGLLSYFVVNSTGSEFKFPASGVSKRKSIFTDNVAKTSILKYGSYGDQPGEVEEIVPREFDGATLPPFSINLLQ